NWLAGSLRRNAGFSSYEMTVIVHTVCLVLALAVAGRVAQQAASAAKVSRTRVDRSIGKARVARCSNAAIQTCPAGVEHQTDGRARIGVR
ncbi:MAG TPA: hypothetical protein VGL67_02725, partial [Casimicrobiaceae bacterium]